MNKKLLEKIKKYVKDHPEHTVEEIKERIKIFQAMKKPIIYL